METRHWPVARKPTFGFAPIPAIQLIQAASPDRPFADWTLWILPALGWLHPSLATQVRQRGLVFALQGRWLGGVTPGLAEADDDRRQRRDLLLGLHDAKVQRLKDLVLPL